MNSKSDHLIKIAKIQYISASFLLSFMYCITDRLRSPQGKI